MHNQPYSFASVAVLVAAASGCASIAGLDDLEVVDTPVEAGTGGASGTAGVAGSAGIAGSAGTSGKAGGGGTAGAAGKAGSGGTAGSAGTAGTGGGGGAGGCEPGTTTCSNPTTPKYCDNNQQWQTLPECAYVCINGACGGVCTPSTKQCLGNTPQQCLETGTGWVNLPECSAVCKNGECVAACSPNTDKQCVGTISMVCNSKGDGWETNPSFPPNGECPFACQNGNCVGECKPGDNPRCNPANSKEVQYCNKEGNWTFQQLCVVGCEAGECIQNCTEDALRCKPGTTTTIEKCANSVWQYVADCTYACFNGVCVDCYPSDVRCDPNNPDNIQKCDATSHTWGVSTWCGANLTCSGGMCVGTGCTEGAKRCQDGKNSLETCVAGAWQSETCPAGSACLNNACGPCTTGSQQCQSDNVTLWVCTGGSWLETGCSVACANNACVDCTGGTVQCLDSANEQNCMNGVWVTSPCNANETCIASAGCTVVSVCTPGERGCSGNAPQVCNAQGQWDTAAVCSGLASTCKGGFCVCSIGTGGPDMVSIGERYCMDRTEVTRGQYQSWATSLISGPGQLAECAWNTNFLSYSTCGIAATCSGSDCSLPQTCVDWCDAYAYCKAVGKRLCGRLAGGSNATTDTAAPDRNTWYNACSAGGNNVFGYGSTYSATACNGAPLNLNALAAVGSIAACHGDQFPSESVYDLSGNAGEWVDTCTAKTGASDQCHIAGGSYSLSQPNPDLKCAVVEAQSRGAGLADVGFRCCSKTKPQLITRVKQFGNANVNEELVDLVAFPDGSAVATGVHAGTLVIDGKSASAPASFPWATFVAKFDGQGNALWVKSVGGTTTVNAAHSPTRAIAGLPDGSILIAGTIQGDAAFDSNTVSAEGESDMFVAKLNPASGAVQFVVHNTGGNPVGGLGDAAMDVSASAGSGFAVVGEYGGTVGFGASQSLTCPSGKQCGFVVRYDTSTATPKWARSSGSVSPGSKGDDTARAVVATNDAVYVAYAYNSDSFLPEATGMLALPLNGAARNAAITKFDLNGVLLWAKRVQGGAPGGVVFPTDLREMPDGRIVMFGSYGVESAGAAVSPTFGPGEPGERQLAAVGNNGRAAFLALFDPSDGRLTMVQRIGGSPGGTGGSTIRGTPFADGSIQIASTFYNPNPFILGQGESNETALAGGTANDKRALFARYNWDGTLNWAQSINSDGAYNDIAANFYPSSPGVFVGGATLHAPVTITVGGAPTLYTSGSNMFLFWYADN